MNFRQAVDKTITRVLGNPQALNNVPNRNHLVSIAGARWNSSPVLERQLQAVHEGQEKKS